MDSNDSFYREIDEHLERAFQVIERPARYDVSTGQESPAVGHPGAKAYLKKDFNNQPITTPAKRFKNHL
jgi:hypothetical protein